MNLSSAPLVDLCQLLGIGMTELATVETGDWLAHNFQVEPADAARLNSRLVRAFTDHYADASNIEIRTGDLTEIVLDPAVTNAAIATFAGSAASGGPYEAIVTVDKMRLAQRLVGTAPVRTVRVFLFAQALRRALTRGIAWFEAEVWPGAPAPLVIAVLDTDVSLIGEHLSVLGINSLDQVAAAAGLSQTAFDFDVISKARDRYIGWDTQWVRALTPWHFDLIGTCSDPELRGLLRAQLVKAAVLFTCDRARTRPTATPPGEILAEYRGREHLAVVPIDEHEPLDCSDDEAAAVLRGVDWCYQRHGADGQPDWVSDRLPFVQTRVAQSLEPLPVEGRLVGFARAMPYLLEGIEWQWKAFIEGKVSDYLDRVQQVEVVVNDTVTGFADRTAALAKSLTETILAAVAVLIGSFIAAAFSTPFNATLFHVGVLTYAGYVFLFPGVIGLLASANNLRRAKAEFESRIKRFNETIFPDKVADIVGCRVKSAEGSYYRWLSFVASVYVAVAVAAIVAAERIPNIVGH